MTNIFLIDGKEPKETDLISLFETRDLLIGKTPFTSVLSVNGKIPFWDLHLERLKKSFEYLYTEYSFETLVQKLELSLKKLPKGGGLYYLRLTMIEGSSEVKLITQIKSYDQDTNKSLGLKTSFHPARLSLLPTFLKYGNYLEVMEEVKKAKLEGFDDSLFLDSEGFVSECSVSNIFFRRGNRFFTPALKGPVLDGVTRKIVLEIFEELGFIYEELSANRAEWESMQEVFITNSLKGLVSISRIDGRSFEVESDFYKKINETYQKKMSAQ